MKYAVDKEDRFTIFKVEESNLNSLIAPKLKSELVILHNERVKNLILDLSEVRFIDSSGLSAILTGHRLWSENDGVFVITNYDNEVVSKMFTISRLDTVLTMIPTKEEAVDYVYMSEIEEELGSSDTED